MAEFVNKFTIQGRTEGLQRITVDLNSVSASQRGLSESAAKMQAQMQNMAQAMQAVDQNTRQLKSANDNLAGSWSSAYSGMEQAKSSFVSTAEATLRAASELKLLAVASYALSPTVRTAANAVGSGLVTALGAVAPAATAAATAIGSRFLAALAPVALAAAPFVALAVAAEAAFKVFEFGGQKIEEYTKLLNAANSAGVSTDFFQRQQKAAEALGIGIDVATEAMRRFTAVSEDKLGGSSLVQEIDRLVDLGNFAKNSFVVAAQTAGTAEDRYKAVVGLITQAMEQGERLAALDLAAKFLPPEMLERLKAQSDYLQQLQNTAANIKPVNVIPYEQLTIAANLNARYNAAVRILGEQFIPFQQTLTEWGFKLQGAWTSILETLAAVVTAIGKVIDSLNNMPAWFVKILSLGGSGVSGAITGAVPGLGAIIGGVNALGGSSQDLAAGPKSAIEPTQDLSAAYAQLAARLGLASERTNAMRQSTEAEMKVLGDTSKATQKLTGDTTAQIDAWDRAVNSVSRHIAQTQADIATIGQDVGVRSQLRAEFKLLEAARESDLGVTQQQIDAYEKLRATMGPQQALQQSGIKLDAQHLDQFLKLPPAVGEVDQKLADQTKLYSELTSAASTFINTLASGLAKGQSLTQTLTQAFSGLGDTLTRLGSQNLIGSLFQGVNANGTKGGIIGGGLTDFLGLGAAAGAPIGAAKALTGKSLNLFNQEDNDDERGQCDPVSRRNSSRNGLRSVGFERCNYKLCA